MLQHLIGAGRKHARFRSHISAAVRHLATCNHGDDQGEGSVGWNGHPGTHQRALGAGESARQLH